MSKTDELLEEMLKWQKFRGMQEAKKVLREVLSSEDEEKQRELRIAYELTDGEYSTSNIASRISVSHVTVSNWQNKWSELGLVSKESAQDSYEHLISLENLGLDVPEIPEPEEEDDE